MGFRQRVAEVQSLTLGDMMAATIFTLKFVTKMRGQSVDSDVTTRCKISRRFVVAWK